MSRDTTYSTGQGDPDDDLRQLFTRTMDDIQPGVHKPAVRDVIARARQTRRHAPAGKPTPLAAILAVAATPLVGLGAVLIGPAGADIFSSSDPRPLPAATLDAAEPLPPLTTPGTQPTPSTAGPATNTGATAVTPLTEVTVYFADQLLVEDGCRRLTAATRLVPADGLVENTLGALVTGPRADERAAGLVSQFAAAGAPAPPITVTADPQRRVAVVDTDESFFAGTSADCRYDDIWRSLERTITQFDGWSFELRLAGSADAATGLLAGDPTRPLDQVPEPSSDDVTPGTDPSAADPEAGGSAAEPTPSSTPSETAATRVTRFTLVDADRDADIGPLVDGATIELSDLRTRNLSIRADTEPATVGSVGWVLDGVVRPSVENDEPYAIRGDNAGDYIPWKAPLGAHVVEAVPYSGPDAGGEPGAALSVTFTVVE